MSKTRCHVSKSRAWVWNRSKVAGAVVACLALWVAACNAQAADTAENKAPRIAAAVVSFVEPHTYRHRAIGMRAAAWVQHILEDSGRWQMVPRARTMAFERRLGIKPPFQAGDLQRIGAKLQAAIVVSGTVGRLALDYRRGAVDVSVEVELTDVATGELIASKKGQGRAVADRANPQPTDVIVERALGKACEAACAKLLRPRFVVTTVAAKAGRNKVKIAAGRKAGLSKGRKCLVLRGSADVGDFIAVVLLDDVGEDAATGVVISEIEPVRVGDTVIAP